MKDTMFDFTRAFPIRLECAKGGLARANNQLFILYVMVLQDGWNIYQVEEMEEYYDVWLSKQGRDHKCITLRVK